MGQKSNRWIEGAMRGAQFKKPMPLVLVWEGLKIVGSNSELFFHNGNDGYLVSMANEY